MRGKLERADVLILAHGAKGAEAWDANYTTFVELADLFIALGKDRLVPPEIWAVGSEAEFHGDMGQADLVDYARQQARLRPAGARLLPQPGRALPAHRALGLHLGDGTGRRCRPTPRPESRCSSSGAAFPMCR